MKPKNKHLTVTAVAQSEKVGSLYVPTAAQEKQYRQGTVTGVAKCDEAEAEDIWVGDVVLYDSYGAVDHRIGDTTVTTVPLKNVIATLSEALRPAPGYERWHQLALDVSVKEEDVDVFIERVRTLIGLKPAAPTSAFSVGQPIGPNLIVEAARQAGEVPAPDPAVVFDPFDPPSTGTQTNNPSGERVWSSHEEKRAYIESMRLLQNEESNR